MSEAVELVPALVAVWLFLVGLYGAVTTRDLLHLVLCVSVLHSSAWLLLVGLAHRGAGTAPALDEDVAPDVLVSDPLLQALTVRDIVVGVAVSALLLACVVRIHRRFGTLDPHQIEVLRG